MRPFASQTDRHTQQIQLSKFLVEVSQEKLLSSETKGSQDETEKLLTAEMTRREAAEVGTRPSEDRRLRHKRDELVCLRG